MSMSSVFRRVGGVALAITFLAVAGCSTTRYERSTGEFVDDKMLGRRVQNALNLQPVYKFPDVHVHTFRGVVQLSGFVASEAQKQAASEIAERVRGVAEVENSISLAPLAPDDLRAFIPGREMNDTNRTEVGGPGRATTTTSSGVTTNNIDDRLQR